MIFRTHKLFFLYYVINKKHPDSPTKIWPKNFDRQLTEKDIQMANMFSIIKNQIN